VRARCAPARQPADRSGQHQIGQKREGRRHESLQRMQRAAHDELRDGLEGVDVDIDLEDESVRDFEHRPLRWVQRTARDGNGLCGTQAGLRRRAEALISIAHPDFRAELRREVAATRHIVLS